MVTRIKSAGVVSNPNLPRAGMDPLMYQANGGILFLADFRFPFSRPKNAPVNGQVIRDISGYPDPIDPIIAGHADGAIRQTASGQIGFAGNGLSFASVTALGNYAEVPAAVAAKLAASQYFIACAFVRLPVEADWAGTTHAPFFTFAEANNGYVNGADLLSIGMVLNGASKRVTVARPYGVSIGSRDTTTITMDPSEYGALAMLSFCRAPEGSFFQLRTPSRVLTQTMSDSGSNALTGIAELTGKFGIGPSLWGTYTGSQRNWRGYRLWFADLNQARDVRRDTIWNDSLKVLAEEWERFNAPALAAKWGVAS